MVNLKWNLCNINLFVGTLILCKTGHMQNMLLYIESAERYQTNYRSIELCHKNIESLMMEKLESCVSS
jgi:hypothetical protein